MIIYKTTNLLTGKFYIGKDEKNNPKYLGSGVYLKRAIKKYGKSNFKKEILEKCKTIDELNESEKYWIKKSNAKILGYNIADGGDGGKTGIPWNKDKKCKSTGPCSEERRLNISIARMDTIKILCIHCKKEVDPGNFNRFHGNMCKLNPSIDPKILKARSEKAKQSMILQKINGTYSKPKSPKGPHICPKCGAVGNNYGAMMRHHFDNCNYVLD